MEGALTGPPADRTSRSWLNAPVLFGARNRAYGMRVAGAASLLSPAQTHQCPHYAVTNLGFSLASMEPESSSAAKPRRFVGKKAAAAAAVSPAAAFDSRRRLICLNRQGPSAGAAGKRPAAATQIPEELLKDEKLNAGLQPPVSD